MRLARDLRRVERLVHCCLDATVRRVDVATDFELAVGSNGDTAGIGRTGVTDNVFRHNWIWCGRQSVAEDAASYFFAGYAIGDLELELVVQTPEMPNGAVNGLRARLFMARS